MSGSIASFRANSREHGASITVAALSSSFGVLLLQATNILSEYIGQQSIARHNSVQVSLTILAIVFLLIAVYVGSIVTANTFATIIAGRRKSIALMRLVGAASGMLRRSIAREGLLVGVIGAVVGGGIGLVLSLGALWVVLRIGILPPIAYPLVDPLVVVPVVIVVLTTWAASWVGTRRILSVTPLEAISSAQEATIAETRARPGRNALAIVMFFAGMGLVILGIAVGQAGPLGLPIAFLGGIFSFTGLTLGAQLIMPPMLRLVGLFFGRAAPAKLAAENALRYPERSSRTTIGLVVGVTLVTMLSVASQTFQALIQTAQASQQHAFAGAPAILDTILPIFSGLIGFSIVIAAVGVVNNLSLSVLQRSRELGLLRALGFSTAQVRRMILIESAQMTFTAVIVGLALGIFYGWAGAQSLLGGVTAQASGVGFVPPAIPLLLIVTTLLVSMLFALVASIGPIRRAVRLSPVAALAVE